MPNRTRKNQIQFYLSDDELFVLEKKFQLSKKKNRAAFLRNLILYGFVYDVDYSNLRELNSTLGKIGSNLNQIAKRINTTNTVYQEDMDEIREMMNQIWQLQKSILSQQALKVQ